MVKQRIEWADTVKYICIIFVILSHLESCTDVWITFYSPFFLTAFFFVSGYVYEPRMDFKHFLKRKIRQLWIPWLVFSVFIIVTAKIVSFNRHGSLFAELYWNFLQIRGHGDGVWFVAALFVAFIPFYYWVNGFRAISSGGGSKRLWMVVAAFFLSFISTVYTRMFPDDVFSWGSAALPWHLEYIFQAMFFMVLGYVFKEQMEERFDKANTFVFRVILCVSYLLMLYVPNAFGLQLPVIGDIFYTYFCQIVGVLLIVAVSKRIRAGVYMKYIGQNTLICFALHGKIYSALQMLLRKTGSVYETILADMWTSTAFSIAFALLISVLLIFPIYVINRYTPFIVGRKEGLYANDAIGK